MNTWLILLTATAVGTALATWAWGYVWMERALAAEAEGIDLAGDVEHLRDRLAVSEQDQALALTRPLAPLAPVVPMPREAAE